MDRLLISLLNTAMEPADALETPFGAARWWAGTGIALAGKPRFDARLCEALRRLRGALAGRLSGTDGDLPLPFRGDASDGIVFEVLHAIRNAAASATMERIRICTRQGCGRYFADETKNGSRRWCSLRCMERARAPRRRTISR